jgi:hypothetical protein
MNFEEFVNSLTDEQKQAMMNAFGVDPNVAKPKPKIEPKQLPSRSVVGEDFKVIREDNNSKGKTPVRAKKNEWHDDGDEFRDVYTPKGERTPRNRDKARKQEVECHVCGRTFQVNPKYVYGEYLRCNRCTGR